MQNFRPTATWDALRLRAQLLDRLREFFKQRDFLEVETPLLSADTVVDRFIDPISVDVGRSMWLQTSPEFCMKRLLAAGAEAIFQICKAFRQGEQGALHNIEFTICEWYRVGDSMHDSMQLLDELSQQMLDRGAAERLTYREAFQQHTGVDPHQTDEQSLRNVIQQRCRDKVESLANYDRDELLNLLLAECVEPQLGVERPTILYDYPASQAALAQIRDEETPVAERFELYVDGVELANGYHELLDPDELRQRMARENDQRSKDGKCRLPEDSRLLAAMKHGLPECTGVALGFDRLVMKRLGATNVDDVLTFPIDRT